MFKNMIKRSWLSLVRKPSRAIILALILFAMANLVLASIAIKGTVAESVDYAKSSLGGTIYLQPDIFALRQQAGGGATQLTPGQAPSFTRPTISLSTVQGIADSDYVKDYTYSVQSAAKAAGFTPVETTNAGGMGGFRMPGSESSTEATLESDVTLQGINSYAFISQVQSGTMSLSSGTYFDESTDDSAIISYDLATSNGIEVGDTINMQNIYTEETVAIKVIGIYDLSEETGFGTSANAIYMNTETAAQFMSTDDFNDGDYTVNNVSYTLNNAENADAFTAEANSKYPDLATDNLTLSIDDTAYEQMVGPIESVGGFATTILWIVVIASIAIVTLIVTINVKDRRYEMGVLLSLGGSKLNVIGQIFVELLIIGTIAFSASAGTSSLVARAMGQGLLDSQVSMSEEQSAENFGRPAGGFGGGMGRTSTSDADTIETIDVSATATDFAILFGVGYGIILLSLVIPAWSIVKYQPKQILAGKE